MNAASQQRSPNLGLNTMIVDSVNNLRRRDGHLGFRSSEKHLETLVRAEGRKGKKHEIELSQAK